jgi:hypothetical protein
MQLSKIIDFTTYDTAERLHLGGNIIHVFQAAGTVLQTVKISLNIMQERLSCDKNLHFEE